MNIDTGDENENNANNSIPRKSHEHESQWVAAGADYGFAWMP